MSLPLQKTKLFLPTARANLVERPRLMQMLDPFRAGGCRAALISAPAGSGKTTVMVQFLNKLAWPVTWVSLDGRDNLPNRFFAYLIAALQMVKPGMGMEASVLLDLPGANLEELIMLLANDLVDGSGPFVLVLDDFHAITNPELHRAIDLLLEAQPPQMRLVLLSREDPTLQLARRRASGQLVELRQDDLRFTLPEVIEFLDREMNLHLSEPQMEDLEKRTEGWIAGLQMVALSLQHTSDTDQFIRDLSGTHQYILDYLMEEVLAHQSSEIRDFLKVTSILGQMCAELCAKITGKPIQNAQNCLEQLVKANLFIVPLDQERRWYRYHQLFGDLLSARLLAENPGRIGELNQFASEWYEMNGDPKSAVEYALKAQNLQRAADLIEHFLTERWQAADLEFMLIVNRLPIELIAQRPSLSLQNAWACILTGQTERVAYFLDAAQRRLSTVDRAYEPNDAANRAFARILRAHLVDYHNKPVKLDETLEEDFAAIPEENPGMRNSVAVLIGTMYYMEGDFTGAIRYYEDALDRDKRMNGTNAIPIAAMRMAWVLQARGQLREAAALLREYAEYIRARGIRRYYIGGALNLVLGEIFLEWNQIEEAEVQIKEGQRLIEDWPSSPVVCLGWSLQTRLKIAQGDLVAARAALERAEGLRRQYQFHPVITHRLEQARVRLCVAEQNMPSLETWTSEYALLADQECRFRYECLLIELCRAWLALDRKEEATMLLERLAGTASERKGSLLAILPLLAAGRSTDPPRALASLDEALRLGEPEGYLRTFLEVGDPLKQVLSAWLVHNRSDASASLRGYALRLSDAFDGFQPKKAWIQDQQTGLVEPLSKRELEVLWLVAKGLTNQQIAAGLVISIRTVKKHIENIHGKLGVINRTQAVAKARELGLLRE